MCKFTLRYALNFLRDMRDEKFARKHLAKYLYRVLIVDDEENIPKEVIIPGNTFNRFSPFHYEIKVGKKVPYGYIKVIDEDGYEIRKSVRGTILDIIEKLPNPNWPDHPSKVVEDDSNG